MIFRARITLLYLVTFCSSLGATLLTMGIFYFTASLWGWDAKHNLTLAALQNVTYIVGSLSAHALSAKFGRRRALICIYSAMALVAAAAAISWTHWVIGAWLLCYMFFTGMSWPMLESLCSASKDAHELSRRVGIYNLTWACAGVGALLMTGLLIERWQVGLFVLPLILHGASAIAMLWILIREGTPSAEIPAPHLQPEADLLRSRTLALWLSRIALPAMYVVNYALGALLPTLGVMRQFSPVSQTLLGSVWVVARLCGFAILGATLFWHTRPRLLLTASAALLIAFCVVTISPSQLFGESAPHHFDVTTMILGQILVGAAMAMIYTASLYFGMVLSKGSTEHGGYHEALIGMGGVIGPGAGAVTQYLWPGDVRMAIAAVSGVVLISVIAGAGVSVVFRKSSQGES